MLKYQSNLIILMHNDTSSAHARKSDYGTLLFNGLRARCLCFFVQKRRSNMPRNQFQRMVFAFLTVLVTVHAYVFYSLYVVNGSTFMALTGKSSVISAINAMGGVSVFNHALPIWVIILIEFVLAYTLEVLMGSPASFKLACKVFDPRTTHPVLFESAIICATVGIMCPAMSFLAAILYYPYYAGFNVFTLLANWLKLVCFNFPFAFFTQLFFIQPLIRTVFNLIFAKDIKEREAVNQ